MKNIKIALFALALLGITTACKDDDFGMDNNRDQYGAYNADHRALLAGAIVNFSQNGGFAYLMAPQLYVQYQSQVTYTTEQQYGLVAGSWSRYYVNQIKNLDKIIKDYENPTNPMLELGAPENMIGVSKIFRAIIYKRITDSYGDAPYTEANKENVNTPKFDKQEDIYKNIITELKAGRDMLTTAKLKPSGDALYDGDVTKWKKLANSVIMQVALQLSNKYPDASGYAATEFKAALASGGIETVADEAWFRYSSSSEVTNPITGFRSADFRLSRELTSSLKGATDAFNRTSNHTPDKRLTIYGTSMNSTGLPFGYSSTGLSDAGFSTSGTSAINLKFRSAETPMQLMTAGYTFLNRAEAAAKGWTSESVSAMLTKGITLNYNSLDIKYNVAISADAATYASARVTDMATVGAAQVIAEEKWVALFSNGFDAWSEWRRTGFPVLKPSQNAVNGGIIPTRMQYPVEEANFNSANYKEAVSRLIPAEDKNTSKVWWDQ